MTWYGICTTISHITIIPLWNGFQMVLADPNCVFCVGEKTYSFHRLQRGSHLGKTPMRISLHAGWDWWNDFWLGWMGLGPWLRPVLIEYERVPEDEKRTLEVPSSAHGNSWSKLSDDWRYSEQPRPKVGLKPAALVNIPCRVALPWCDTKRSGGNWSLRGQKTSASKSCGSSICV